MIAKVPKYFLVKNSLWRTIIHNYNVQNPEHNLFIPRPKTEALKKSFVYRRAVWWNSLSLTSLKQSKPLANIILETLYLKQLIKISPGNLLYNFIVIFLYILNNCKLLQFRLNCSAPWKITKPVVMEPLIK